MSYIISVTIGGESIMQNKIHQWLNSNVDKKRIFKEAAHYRDIYPSSLHWIVTERLLPIDLVKSIIKHAPDTVTIAHPFDLNNTICVVPCTWEESAAADST